MAHTVYERYFIRPNYNFTLRLQLTGLSFYQGSQWKESAPNRLADYYEFDSMPFMEWCFLSKRFFSVHIFQTLGFHVLIGPLRHSRPIYTKNTTRSVCISLCREYKHRTKFGVGIVVPGESVRHWRIRVFDGETGRHLEHLKTFEPSFKSKKRCRMLITRLERW